jgi:hypothetical protein
VKESDGTLMKREKRRRCPRPVIQTTHGRVAAAQQRKDVSGNHDEAELSDDKGAVCMRPVVRAAEESDAGKAR